nr:MAG TPA: hypothetical protein [Caudoviricetes sp.]
MRLRTGVGIEDHWVSSRGILGCWPFLFVWRPHD